MKKAFIITLAIFSFSMFYAEETLNEKRVNITIVPGEKWVHKMKVSFFTIDLYPQMAIWVKSETTQQVKSILVANKSGKQKWLDAKTQKDDEPFRKYALPVWLYHFKEEFNRFPTKNDPVPDGITSATPKKTFTKKIDSLFEGENLIYFEINNSFDVNPFYMKEPSDNGQPSLIYSVTISKDSEKGIYPLKLIGIGSHNGESGNINEDLSGITDAKDILKEIFITIE